MGEHKTQLPMNCKACGVEFWTRAYFVTSGRRKYCSAKCSSGGAHNGNFKGGRRSDYEYKKASISRYPEKHRCRVRWNYATGTGKVTPQPCFVGGSEDAEGHHWDYDKPLDVFWLCKKHHAAVHKKEIELPLPYVPVFPAV